MNAHRPTARPALGWLFTLIVIGFIGSLWAPTAYADNSKASSTPEEGSTVDSSPTEIDIVFKEPEN